MEGGGIINNMLRKGGFAVSKGSASYQKHKDIIQRYKHIRGSRERAQKPI
jgi:hypothetical protein